MSAVSRQKIGVLALDGLAYISFIEVPMDMKDSGRMLWPMYIHTVCGNTCKFHKAIQETGNVLYKEVEDVE